MFLVPLLLVILKQSGMYLLRITQWHFIEHFCYDSHWAEPWSREGFVGLIWTLKGRQAPKSSAVGGCAKCCDETEGRLFSIREQHLNKLRSGWIFEV